MIRVSSSVTRRQKHKKVLKLAKGYYGRAKNCYRLARSRVEKGLQYAYRDRKNKKRTMRALWITRINGALRSMGLKYSVFINHLNKSDLDLNRKFLAYLAFVNNDVFHAIVHKVMPPKV